MPKNQPYAPPPQPKPKPEQTLSRKIPTVLSHKKTKSRKPHTVVGRPLVAPSFPFDRSTNEPVTKRKITTSLCFHCFFAALCPRKPLGIRAHPVAGLSVNPKSLAVGRGPRGKRAKKEVGVCLVLRENRWAGPKSDGHPWGSHKLSLGK